MTEPIELRVLPRLRPDAFARDDEGDDGEFYGGGRPSPPLDSLARATAAGLLGQLLIGERPRVLDLMAAEDSHLPEGLDVGELVGLGLDRPAMESNPRLDRRVVHDLNAEPRLPFDDASFDAVLCSFSFAYLAHPFDAIDDLGRVLRPGGLLAFTFTNRSLRTKTTRVWRHLTEQRRLDLVAEMLMVLGHYERIDRFRAVGRPRPADDLFSDSGMPSDPVYAVWADRLGADPERPPRPRPDDQVGGVVDRELVERRKARVAETLRCPYCDEPLTRWEIEVNPFTEWNSDHVWVCLENRCPYLSLGWAVMDEQGNRGFSYRLMYNPDLGRCMPTPIAGLGGLRSRASLPRG